MVDEDLLNAIKVTVIDAVEPIYRKINTIKLDVNTNQNNLAHNRRDIDANLDLISYQASQLTGVAKRVNSLWNDKKWVYWLVGIVLSMAGMVTGYFLK